MHLSNTTTAAVLALGLIVSAPVCAGDGPDGAPALRLPGEPRLPVWPAAPALRLRAWALELTGHLAVIARPSLPELRWRDEGVAPAARWPAQGTPVLVERTRGALTARWQPWTLGHWRLGAALGLQRTLPGHDAPAWAAMPVASYEQPRYRVHLGLVPPGADRPTALVLGLSLPLH